MGTCRNCGLALPTEACAGTTCPRCASRVVVPDEPSVLAPGTAKTAVGKETRGSSGDTWPVGGSDTAEPLKRVGKYELRGELGRGGMGVVYEAWDTQLLRRAQDGPRGA